MWRVAFSHRGHVESELTMGLAWMLRAMALVRECELIKIDDILPFFPDFVRIDHFKVSAKLAFLEYNSLLVAVWY